MGSVVDFQSLDESLDNMVLLYHEGGMSYDDIAQELFVKSQVVKCIAEGERNGLNDMIRQMIKNTLEDEA